MKNKNHLPYKVDNPYLVNFLIETPIFAWYVIWCGSKMVPKRLVSKRKWKICWKYSNYSRLNDWHNWGGSIWPFNNHKDLHSNNKWDIHMGSESDEESGYVLNLDFPTIFYKLCGPYPKRFKWLSWKKLTIEDPPTLTFAWYYIRFNHTRYSCWLLERYQEELGQMAIYIYMSFNGQGKPTANYR